MLVGHEKGIRETPIAYAQDDILVEKFTHKRMKKNGQINIGHVLKGRAVKRKGNYKNRKHLFLPL